MDISDLDRRGAVEVKGSVPPDDDLWEAADLELAGPMKVDLTVTSTAVGQILVQGGVSVPLRHRCRRCLADVVRELAPELTLVWSPPDELQGDAESVEIRRLDPAAVELDLGDAVREELILAAPAYLLCREDCQGLCPRCGVDRNVESCDCSLNEPDPRWDALRALKKND
ncbi:MAG: DUF177 domain-containing protein [Gemmatimonadota bacterium]